MSMEKPFHILIVDDDANHLKTLGTIIKTWNYEVSAADDGTKAIEMIKQNPYALILMDVRMTKMSGIEALKKIKASFLKTFNQRNKFIFFIFY